jgi:hypothetical protein
MRQGPFERKVRGAGGDALMGLVSFKKFTCEGVRSEGVRSEEKHSNHFF